MRRRSKDEDLTEEFEIKNPLDDSHIFMPPKYDIKIVKGEPVTIPKLFKQTMITRGIIKE